MPDDALIRGARDLHAELDRVDDSMTELLRSRDLHERLVTGAALVAEDVQAVVRTRGRLIRHALLALALLWSPGVAYGAVYVHQLVLTNCASDVHPEDPRPGAWYCDLFPNTHDHEPETTGDR